MTNPSTSYLAFAVACVGLALAGPAPGAAMDRYVVRLQEDQPRSIEVEATLVPRDGALWMNDDADQGLPAGWGGFVEAIEVVDDRGESIEVEPAGLSRWRLRPLPDQAITVRYRVRLQHDRTPLNFGDNGAAYARGGAVMWSGRALFVAGEPTAEVEVRFELPPGWRVTTPWRRAAPAVFRPGGTDDLVNSAFMAGRHSEALVRDGGLEVRIALAGEQVQAGSALFADELRKYVRYFRDLFGSSPERTMLLVAADSSYWGGEVMGRAISLSVGGRVAGSNPMLSHIFAHEIVHLWGLDINFDRAAEPELYWFYEGMFAEYLSWLANVRAGDLSEEGLRRQIATDYRKYRSALGSGRSMVEAGHRKAENYDLIYSGGMIVGLAIDLAARRRTQNREGLEDFLVGLFRDFPSSDGIRARPSVALLRVEELVEQLRLRLGPAIADDVRSWLSGEEPVPLVELGAAAGLEVVETEDGEMSIEIRESAPPELRRIWSTLVAAR